MMTHTTRYTQTIEQDVTLTIEWEIEYQVTGGYPGDRIEPAGDDELEIVGKTIQSMTLWVLDKQGVDVRLYDLGQVDKKLVTQRFAALLNEETLLMVCERHWERIGMDEEREAA